jgi:pectinesterase
MTNARRICFLFALITIVSGSAFASAGYDFVVSKDSSGNFRTIQESVNACRDYAERRYVIFVKNGIYEEKLVIPTWKTHITIIGQNVDSTVVTYNDYSGKIDGTGNKLRTFTSFTCQVAGNNIIFENITFVNSAGRMGQAVAMHAEGDRCVFRNCRFIGNQDTLLASGENARQYFDRCYIEGTTDFIFGAATAVFDRCMIVSKTNSYITAASTPPAKEFGFVFLSCKILTDSVGRKVYLGRPWRLYAFTAFINCELGEHIRPEGWHNWSKPEAEKTARYMEYKNMGPGANPAARVAWSHQLNDEEVKSFTVANVLKGFDNWNPMEAK